MIPDRLRSRATAFAHDLLMVPIAWIGAYWLRFNFEPVPSEFWHQALQLLPLVCVVQGATFWYFGLYRGIWRFASVPDLVRILKAVGAGIVVAATAIFALTRLEGVPRSVFILDGVLLVALLTGPRLLYRWMKDRHLYIREGKSALIVGAGRAGEMLVRDLLRNADSPYRPVAFVDDDQNKVGRELHGLPVRGPCEEIPALARNFGVDLILIALPSADSRSLRRIVEICETTGLPFRALPPMQDLVSGKVGVKELREVTIDDLLGREPVKLDWQAIERGLHGRTIMVTGGGGSIGSELCRQIARHSPGKLVIVEQSEFNLFEIDRELRARFPKLDLTSVLADVCDTVAIDAAFQRYAPSAVYHAAAYKHVPMLENQARAAVMNNILGTQVVADATIRHGCETFVLVSTDKAVNPANIMGASKRAAEIYCQHLSGRSATRFVTVRFGNVLGSAGSVVPIFREQIARGGPVTVTHPDITRYFMTIPEASQLILQAAAMGKGGEIFVLDMGEPVKIAYLAEQMIRLSGRQPGEDIEIVFTGLRPGEKLYEELFHDQERLAGTAHPKIMLARSRETDADLLQGCLTDFEKACAQANERQAADVLSRLVPEYKESAPESRRETASVVQLNAIRAARQES